MNYMIYGKHDNDKKFFPMDLASGNIRVGLVYATLIADIERAKKYANELTTMCPDFNFQVREAGKSK